jgi:hypothetical protein
MIHALADLPTQIHFSYNLWTSPNHCALLGIVDHWVPLDGILPPTLLGLRRFRRRHTGTNQAESFWAVAQEYKLKDDIGYFTLDSAINNDTTMKCICAKLKPLEIDFNPVKCRLQ